MDCYLLYKPMRIVIIDDNHTELITIKKVLEKFFARQEKDCKIFIFQDIQTLIDNLLAVNPDIAIIDIVLHYEKDAGFKLKKLLDKNNITTILMSGYPDVYLKDKNIELYKYDYQKIIRKPFMVEQIYSMITEALS